MKSYNHNHSFTSHPLEEAVGEHEAAAVPEGRSVGGLLGGGLGAGIDHPIADGRVVGPGGDQSPSEPGELASTSFGTRPNDGHGLGRGDVVAELDAGHLG